VDGVRADARRSIAAILDAGLAYAGANGDVNMARIAQDAGVGRVTLYAHFPSKEALVDALVRHAIDRAAAVLGAVDVERGPAGETLAALVAESWQVLDNHRHLMVAGMRYLGPERMRTLHDPALAHVQRLVARGRADGDIRADLPADWLVTTVYTLLHAAADEANAGRLDPAEAGRVLAATIVAALQGPLRGPR